MLVDSTYEGWGSDLRAYEKAKRTKKPFGPELRSRANLVTHQEMKLKEVAYNPLLGTFTDPNIELVHLRMEKKAALEKAEGKVRPLPEPMEEVREGLRHRQPVPRTGPASPHLPQGPALLPPQEFQHSQQPAVLNGPGKGRAGQFQELQAPER
jgi:hypothetical protein